MWLILIIIVLIVLFIYMYAQRNVEGFATTSGNFCNSCTDKNFNQCTNCFNCGYCVDRWGNSKCIAGNVASGPANNEQCALWYPSDDWQVAKEHNKNYKLSYGPKQSNRVIGIYPC